MICWVWVSSIFFAWAVTDGVGDGVGVGVDVGVGVGDGVAVGVGVGAVVGSGVEVGIGSSVVSSKKEVSVTFSDSRSCSNSASCVEMSKRNIVLI